MRVIFHGECIVKELETLPEGLTLIPTKEYMRIAESETTGNHHQVLTKDKKITFYEKNGLLYAKVNEPTIINCVLKERHDETILPIGLWEFSKAKEFDPFTEQRQDVFD